MRIEVYGRQSCTLCQSAKRKIQHLLRRWDIEATVQTVFINMDTEAGAAEADFFDVFDIPTVLILNDLGSVIVRWDGKAPPSEELQALLDPGAHSSASAA